MNGKTLGHYRVGEQLGRGGYSQHNVQVRNTQITVSSTCRRHFNGQYSFVSVGCHIRWQSVSIANTNRRISTGTLHSYPELAGGAKEMNLAPGTSLYLTKHRPPGDE